MSMVNIKDWIIYDTSDIGPLQYVDRFNGGGLAFKYNKKSKELIIARRGINTPHCYEPHSGGRKSKKTGQFYKFKTITEDIYYARVEDVEKYLPNELPEKFVFSKNTIEDEDEDYNNIISCLDDFISTLNDNENIIIDVDIDDVFDIENINVIKVIDKNSSEIIFIINKIDDEEYSISTSIDDYIYKSNVTDTNQFIQAINEIINNINKYGRFNKFIETINDYLFN